MSAEENKAVLRRTVEEVNKGNHAAFWEVMAPNIVITDETGRQFNKQEYREWLEGAVLSAFPDYHLVIEDLIAAEEKVVVRFTESGTMKGNLMGMEATGKTFTAPAIEIWRFANGKLIEHWQARDTLSAGIQMGIFPAGE